MNTPIKPGVTAADHSILVVDDEPVMCGMLERLLHRESMTVQIAHNGRSALDTLAQQSPDLMLLDYRLPDMTGQDVLDRARIMHPALPVIVITGHADIPTAVRLMQAGAVDCLSKPFDHPALLNQISTTLKRGRTEARSAPERLKARTPGLLVEPLEYSMGTSAAVQKLLQDLRRVAATRFNVLVTGETGTGKELVSRGIHHYSFDGQGPFIAVDCGALPESLLESELFGHEKGAFTGALSRKLGKFELAHGGTLFLDEISNLSLSAQATLLRAIQERVFFRVGGTEPIQAKVRLVAACNIDLLERIERGDFRDDLYFRLNEFSLCVPSLRERVEDLPFLVRRFLRESNAELCKTVKDLTPNAEALLLNHDWPGNVRELRNVVRQAALLADDLIDVNHIQLPATRRPACQTRKVDRSPTSTDWSKLSLRAIVRRQTVALERHILVDALRHTRGHKLRAAKRLSIDYKTLLTKLREYAISEHDWQAA